MDSIDLSVVMPCLDEEKTIVACINEAKLFFDEKGISGEIIVVDNGSEDNSARVAKRNGARVFIQKKRGYGIAIRTGLKVARGNVIIISDCDMTYDLYNLSKLYDPLVMGYYDMMIGDRFAGMERGAMSLSHRIGVRALSFIGRLRYRVSVRDFHCGLRGMTKDAADTLAFNTEGMEFATEMIAKAAKNHLRIGQSGVVLRRCPYIRESKLRTIRDGLRHLIYMIYS